MRFFADLLLATGGLGAESANEDPNLCREGAFECGALA